MEPYDYPVNELIPQRSPMVMLDKLVSVNENMATGQLLVREDNLFVKEGYLQEPGLIEFMAQTAAAHTGYRSVLTDEPVSEGYIGAIKNLVIHELPSVHAALQADITIENEIVGYTIISGKVRMDKQVIAECEMRILTKS